MKRITLAIDGMTCSACSTGLEKYLNKQKGILNATVNLVMAIATVEYDEKVLDQPKIEEFIKQAGFKSLGEWKEIKLEKQGKKEKIKLIIFSILAIFIMYVSMHKMLHLPSLPFLDPERYPTNYIICLFLLTICFLIYGLDILKNGYKNLIHKTPNMDTLVGIGVLSSFLYSVYNMVMILKGNHHLIMDLYFESSAIVIYFIKLGRYIDGISKDKTKEAIKKLVEITPNTAVLKINDQEVCVTIDEIQKGDTVISKAGEKIAVDGEIIVGSAHLDESFITGESKPVLKEKGSKVIAGSMNYNGYIEYKAEKIGKESTVSEIVKLVVEASNTKSPMAKLADTVAGYFVPIVIGIAILTFLGYLIAGQDFSTALTTFVTILVVACPCSLGLATPLAIVISEGVCASSGILVKKSEILENAQKVDTIVFDKTGTLTYGKLKISEIINNSDMDERTLMKFVGSIEKKSTHPIGKAFVEYLEENKIGPLEVKNFENIAGLGVIGQVNNKKIYLGNAKMFEKYKIPNPYTKNEKRLAEKGNSIVLVGIDEKIVSLIGVNDMVRKEAKEVIETLTKHHIKTIMLTGDKEETASQIAKEIGITTVVANVLPKEKTTMIQKLKKENKFVMMCGDGINDSPALASADIGISVNSGTDIAMDSSDVILTSNHLESILSLLKISKKTVKNIKQNLFWAFFYNALMIPIAMGILKPLGISLNPMLASLAMIISSMTVIVNALRLKR